MEGGWFARMRWRRRGAWLWPAFVLVTVLDGVIMNALPVAGDGQSVYGAIALALFLNIIAVLFGSRPIGALLRRRRGHLPAGVARDYGGTTALFAVTAALVAAGLAHHPVMQAQRQSMQDAIARAEAYIGDHAPAAFRANVRHTDTYAIQPGSVYRTCVPDVAGSRAYCVVVRTALPLAVSVIPAGSEPNATMFEGSN